MSKMGQYIIELEELGEIEHMIFPDGNNRYIWKYDQTDKADFTIKTIMVNILVHAGFALDFYANEGHWYIRTDPDAKNSAFDPEMNPAADTYDGHLQAFTLEDWFKEETPEIWAASKNKFPPHAGQSSHRWRLKRIIWCARWLMENPK